MHSIQEQLIAALTYSNDPNPRLWTGSKICSHATGYVIELNLSNYYDYIHSVYIESLIPPKYNEERSNIIVKIQAYNETKKEWFDIIVFTNEATDEEIHLPIFKLTKINLRITSSNDIKIKLLVGKIPEIAKNLLYKVPEKYSTKFIIHNGIIETNEDAELRKELDFSSKKCKKKWFSSK
jgi:hypothetical protein